VGWMEENEASLKRKQSVWHKQVKDQVFADHDEITLKRVKEKVQNMRAAWKEARKLGGGSGSGSKPEDSSPSFVALLEKKCPFFWRLDGVWGTHPHSTPILPIASTQRAVNTHSHPAANTPLRLAASQPAADASSSQNPVELGDDTLEVADAQAAAVGSDAEPDRKTNKSVSNNSMNNEV